MMWQPELETMPREQIRALQSERLVAQVKKCYERVPLFRKRMDEKGLTPDDIHGIEDITKLPFMYKNDLRDEYPYGLFAEPLENIVRIHASSGTTGKKIVAGYTANDVKIWDDCVARIMTSFGATSEDKVQVSYGYGLFTGGLGAHGGASAIGAMVIPTSSGNTANQLSMMHDLKATCLCCTPSYAMYLGEAAQEAGLTDGLSLKYGMFGAEPWTEDMRHKIEESLHIKAFDIYGLTEILGPGVSGECEYQAGMHVWEDHFIPEIIDPETLEPVPEGEDGELVFTTITKEGMPIIRYRTRDICSLNYEPCKCGRTHVRMRKPHGRTDDMLIIRGVNVFPSQIEEVLLNAAGVTPNYQIIVGRENNTDTFDINVEMNEELFADDVKTIENNEKKITAKLREVLGITAKVHLVNPKSITRSEGKAKRVIDTRNLT